MLRQDSPSLDPDHNGQTTPVEAHQSGLGGIDIQLELNHLEEMILDSPRIPLTKRTLVNEEQLLDHLDLVRLNLPAAFQEADAIIREKEEILFQAEQYAEEIIEAAEVRAAQILNEIGIIRQAEREAELIRQQVQQECEVVQEQTLAELDNMRIRATQELEQMRLQAIGEAEEIQQGADDYADIVLKNIEQHLSEMLRVIRNGRQQLQPEPPSGRNPSSSPKKNQ